MPERPKPRWYHLTPDRFLVGLLLAVGVLFLSEWSSCFPFNERKGWTVLIAIGAVCGAVPFLLVWFIVALIFRRRFQFSIRSLLVFVLVCAVVCSWFAVKMKQARRQRELVAAIREGGGWVYWDYEVVDNPHRVPLAPYRMPLAAEPPTPAWLVNLLGVDLFEDVVHAECGSDFGDENMVYLSELADLRWLSLGTPVTDSGLVHLETLTKLEQLFLDRTQVTGGGLEHVKGLAKLELLALDGTQVTDSSLEHLKGFTNLHALSLTGTKVTDAGLEHLGGLTSLQMLFLTDTKVTDEGVKKLQHALPKCEIYH
ncbi:MAG: leucine-rich repeat domain-containing protein [Planctomycetota bacterium]|jgi:hypothetical protein